MSDRDTLSIRWEVSLYRGYGWVENPLRFNGVGKNPSDALADLLLRIKDAEKHSRETTQKVTSELEYALEAELL